MATDSRDFLFDTNYNILSNYTRVKYGINKPLLETELNEMQKIQEEARASLIRQIIPTGFLEVVRKDFLGAPIVYSPNNTDNAIAIAPSRFFVNGYEGVIEGKDTVGGVSGYTIVNLGEAPFAAVKYYEFVFMEIWFEELTAESNVYKYGNNDGVLIKNNMLDDRVKEETSRRVVMKYKLRVQHGVDIDKWSYGFGFNNISDYSNIYASGPKSVPIENSNYLFMNATNAAFKDAPFYGDSGLFVAGRPSPTSTLNSDFGVLDNYIFAIPLLAVKRRNQKTYSIAEPNGASRYINSITASDRPDGLFYNRIAERDVQDLRKIVSFGQINTEKLLDSGLNQLITGNLTTKSKEIVERIQFGVSPIDVSSRTDVILNAQFNKSLSPLIGPTPTSVGTVQYDLCATGYGVIIDGTTTVSYKPVPVLNWIDKNQGTIEFFIRPFWDGADSSISQTVFVISDDLGNIIMSLTKEQGNLIFTQKQNASASSSVNKVLVLMNNYKVNNNSIYHIRLTWDKINNESNVYINGQKAGFGSFLLSALTPTTLKIGAIETVGKYTSNKVGFIIDELIVYNKVLSETFPQISYDVTNRFAKIYPSFNGILRSFKDNSHIQNSLITTVTTVNNTNTLLLSAPYDTTISVNTPSVYNPTTGTKYSGTWSNLNTAEARFTLGGSVKFTGEKVWIQYDINVDGGNGLDDVPSTVIKAQINGENMAFSKSSEYKKRVLLINEDGTYEMAHKGYDYNSNRTGKDAFARTIDYVFESNGTNKYLIPSVLYGMKVIGVSYVNRPVKSLTKNTDGSLILELVDTVLYNDSFIASIALGGYTFDYDTHSKSIVSNVMKATMISIVAPGNTDTFNIPVYSDSNPNGGVIVSLLDISHNVNNISTSLGTTVFLDGVQTSVQSISGIGTPFVTVKFNSTPQLNKVIDIPVLVTYQPLTSDALTVWYEYVPYQGTLDGNPKTLKRLSEWKLFTTTLGSGNVFIENIKDLSINNASNRLPGGQKLSYILNGSDINFVGEQFTQVGNYKANKKLRFFKEFTDLVDNNKLDDYFNVLDTDILIQKLYGDHQDSKLSPPFSTKGFYLPDTNAVSKYMGAACLVIDDMGNVLLFVIGQIKADPTSSSVVNAVHGDLFKLNNSPILITRRY